MNVQGRRFAIRRDPAWRPLLAAFGGTAGQSYVEVGAANVHFRFGWGFDATIPITEIGAARRIRVPLLGGIGWRLRPGGVGLFGSHQGVVAVQLRSPRRIRLVGIPWTVRRISVSLEEPNGFLAALAALGVDGAWPSPG